MLPDQNISTFYWTGKKNFGDLLAPLLINKFCHFNTKLTDPANAQIFMVGSIAEFIPKDWIGVVAGIGKLHENTNIEYLKNSKILSLRGPLSAKGLSVKNIVFGDPGLLCNELVEVREKKYDLGLVPHWTDTALEQNPIFKKYNPKIIRVSDDPLKVIKEIGECKKIVSSSLHGIIIADAFGIPRRIEISPRVLSHAHQEGGLFKWRDYSASLGVELELGVTKEIKRTIITDKQHEIFDIFEEIRSIFSETNI